MSFEEEAAAFLAFAVPRKWSITIDDTREGPECRVVGVPAVTEEEACRMVAEKRGWRYVEAPEKMSYAVDPVYFERWFKETENIEEFIRGVEAGAIDEFRGLYSLYEDETTLEQWGD